MNWLLLRTHYTPGTGLGKINIPEQKIDIVTVISLPPLLLTLMLVICSYLKFAPPIVCIIQLLLAIDLH